MSTRCGAVIVRAFGMDDREMGRRIGYWRRRRKLTQAVFADRLGRSKSWVEKVERGERSADRLSVLDAICGVLQIDISALIGQEPARRAAACIDDSEVERIRSALERYPLGQEAAEGPICRRSAVSLITCGPRSSSAITR